MQSKGYTKILFARSSSSAEYGVIVQDCWGGDDHDPPPKVLYFLMFIELRPNISYISVICIYTAIDIVFGLNSMYIKSNRTLFTAINKLRLDLIIGPQLCSKFSLYKSKIIW